MHKSRFQIARVGGCLVMFLCAVIRRECTSRPTTLVQPPRHIQIILFTKSAMLFAWHSRVPHHSRRSHPHAKLRAPLPAHRFKHVCNRWCGRTRNTTCVNNRTCELLKLNAGNLQRYCVLLVYKDCRFALSAFTHRISSAFLSQSGPSSRRYRRS